MQELGDLVRARAAGLRAGLVAARQSLRHLVPPRTAEQARNRLTRYVTLHHTSVMRNDRQNINLDQEEMDGWSEKYQK